MHDERTITPVAYANLGISYGGDRDTITRALEEYNLAGDIPPDLEARTVAASRRIDALEFKGDPEGDEVRMDLLRYRPAVQDEHDGDEVPLRINHAVCILAVLMTDNAKKQREPQRKPSRVRAGNADVEWGDSTSDIQVAKSDAQIWADRLDLVDARVFTLLRPFLRGIDDLKQDDRSRGTTIANNFSAVVTASANATAINDA